MILEVTVYGKAGCQGCRATTRFLEKNEIPYVYHDVEDEPDHRKVVEFLGHKTLPVVVVGDVDWGGFKHAKLLKLVEILKSDGYDELEAAHVKAEQAAVEYLRREMLG